MVEHGKRKKHHDKDKFYRLAKEQGLRSRAAFKLSQINRKYRILDDAKVVIDLCAAPGGWTQIVSRSLPRTSSTLILAVDVLPIRAINPSVKTIVGDVTTDKCKALIRQEMKLNGFAGGGADVVLCDGAPNVGSSYDRDAYAQNEIALHCLKCATEHLRSDGTFVTKLYRSRDYSAYLWVAKQFFRNVHAVKPAASRSTSAEIFLVCEGYLAPSSIDPKMLDPKSAFETVDGAATGGGDARAISGKKMNVFHKGWDAKRRSRQGYDDENLDATMRNVGSVAEFVEGGTGDRDDGKEDPVSVLSSRTGLAFRCHLCQDEQGTKRDGERGDDDGKKPGCRCGFYLNHPLTTPEVKTCVSDLKVLNRSDFKGLLAWRSRIREALDLELSRSSSAADADGETSDADEDGGASDDDDQGRDSDAEEESNVQSEIEALRLRRSKERKRKKKKEREVAAKRRRRAALGMDLNALEVPDNDKIFSLKSITTEGDLEAAREVDLGKVDDDDVVPGDSDGEEEDGTEGAGSDEDDDAGRDRRLDRELDEAYDRYLAETKNKSAKVGTKMAKRSKKLARRKAEREATEDADMMRVGDDAEGLGEDARTYAKMLRGPKDSDDDDDDDDSENETPGSDDDDDGFRSEPRTPEEHAAAARRKSADRKGGAAAAATKEEEKKNPLIHVLEEPSSARTARWFSNPLFQKMGEAARSATDDGKDDAEGGGIEADGEEFDSDDGEREDSEGERRSDGDPPKTTTSERRERKKKEEEDREGAEETKKLTADDVLAMMPKTDKEIRKEKRKRATERKERRDARRARAADDPGGFEVAPGDDDEKDDGNDDGLRKLTEGQKAKVLEARALIKAGVGRTSSRGTEKDAEGFEVVSAAETRASSRPLPIVDDREYNSDNEDYDSDDRAATLALGTMMLRRSKAKALVDASYNRFAWNDPEDLPDWFVDDEHRHYRPQLPIPPELIAKMKEKYIRLSTRPIAKVAEARARKGRRAKAKLQAAKKKAEAVANSSEMSEATKLRAISKAMRGQDAKAPGKTYVVSKKNGRTKGGKGVKLVDKRMKNDKRGMERAAKKRKGGKRGGLTGSKKRRHHK